MTGFVEVGINLRNNAFPIETRDPSPRIGAIEINVAQIHVCRIEKLIQRLLNTIKIPSTIPYEIIKM